MMRLGKSLYRITKITEESDQFKGRLAESSQTLYEALQFRDKAYDLISNLYVYAHLKMDQDTANAKYQGLHSRAGSLVTKLMSALSYYDPEILAMDESALKQFLNENKDLQLYAHLLEELNLSRPYILSEKEEALLANAGEVLGSSSNTFNTLNNADMKFPTIKDENGEEIEITHGRYGKLLESNDPRVRKDAFLGVYSVYEGLKNTLASTLNGQVKKSNFYASTRGYKSAREAALSGNHIPETVYDSLLKSVNNNASLLHRYVKLRKELLGLEELHMYDLYTPLSDDVNLEFTYEEAKEIVLEALKPLGDEYQSILKEAFDSRWIDVMENKGKRSGHTLLVHIVQIHIFY